MSVNHDSGDCFYDGWLELIEFAAKYERLGMFGFDDWQIVSEVSSAVSKMLREGRERGCPNTEDMIVNIVVRTLDDLGIDRYSIMRGYLHGTTEDVRRVLMRIFPNVEQITGLPPSPIRTRTGTVIFSPSTYDIDYIQSRNTDWSTMSSSRLSPSSVGGNKPRLPPNYVNNRYKPSLNKEPSGEPIKKRSSAIEILKKIGEGIGIFLVALFVLAFLGFLIFGFAAVIAWIASKSLIAGLILIIIILIIVIIALATSRPRLEPPR
jgi:hypothetical protein